MIYMSTQIITSTKLVSANDTESKMEVSVIILSVVLGIVYILCAFITTLLCYYKKKYNKSMEKLKENSNKDSIKNNAIVIASNQNDMSVASIKSETMVEEGNAIDPKGKGDLDGEYKMIINRLKKCADDDNWKRYLDNFKQKKMTDTQLKYIIEGDLLKELIPDQGVRCKFQLLCEGKSTVFQHHEGDV